METFEERIKVTTEAIQKFKRESEANILGRNLSSSSRLGKGPAVLSPYSHVSGAECGSMLGNILNTDCIIIPYSPERNAHQKLWPHALVANRASAYGEIGQVESHGSLWQLVPFIEGETTRIILQCAVRCFLFKMLVVQILTHEALPTQERGEVPMYLGPDLNLVEMKGM